MLTTCRDFIANNFWPSKGVEGSKLNDMYQKIKISEEKAKTAGGEHDKAKTAGEPEHKLKSEPGSQEKGQGASAEQEKAKSATNGEEAKAT